MDNGDPVFIRIAQTGVVVKKSISGLMGPKLYKSQTANEAATTADALAQLFPKPVTPPWITDPVLRSFINATLHCSSAAEVLDVLNTAVARVAE
ncbi:MAG: hypothetical protein P8127_07005 [Acidobacteriota bacterium]